MKEFQNENKVEKENESGAESKYFVEHGWKQRFMDRCKKNPRKQPGKLIISGIMQEQVEWEVAFHLGVISRMFANMDLDDYVVENVDAIQESQ